MSTASQEAIEAAKRLFEMGCNWSKWDVESHCWKCAKAIVVAHNASLKPATGTVTLL